MHNHQILYLNCLQRRFYCGFEPPKLQPCASFRRRCAGEEVPIVASVLSCFFCFFKETEQCVDVIYFTYLFLLSCMEDRHSFMHRPQATLPNGDTFDLFKIMVARSVLWFSFICRRQITCNLCVLAGALASCVYFGPVLL